MNLNKIKAKVIFSDDKYEQEEFLNNDKAKRLYNLINKPVETTNEKPIEIEELENFPVMCLCGEHTEEWCADYCTE